MPSRHLSAVMRVADWLAAHGLRGRADHIGNHRFQRRRMGLFVGRFRPDILLTEGDVRIAVEIVCPPVLRGGRLVEALRAYRGSGMICIVIAPANELEALRNALFILDLEPFLITSSTSQCCSAILTAVEHAANTVQTKLAKG